MTQTNKLRWGILGAARVNERLLPAIATAHNAQLVAIASRRPQAAAQTLARYAPTGYSARCYDNLEALLTAPDIDAIYCPLANQEHAEWTLKAIAQGKHVLCEKPMALQLADIEAISQAAAQQGVTVMEGFMYRFHPQHARVRDLIQSGLIGEIRSVRSSFSFMMRPARLYRLAEPIARGGGAMWDIGCYAIHVARMFFDTLPTAVLARLHYTPSGADDSASGILEFGNGRWAQFDFSFDRARRCEYEIIGTRGGIKCHIVWQLPGDLPIISWWTEGGQSAEERLPYSDHFKLEIEHFSDCVLTGTAPLLSLADAHANCNVINAALQSATTHSTVTIT